MLLHTNPFLRHINPIPKKYHCFSSIFTPILPNKSSCCDVRRARLRWALRYSGQVPSVEWITQNTRAARQYRTCILCARVWQWERQIAGHQSLEAWHSRPSGGCSVRVEDSLTLSHTSHFDSCPDILTPFFTSSFLSA